MKDLNEIVDNIPTIISGSTFLAITINYISSLPTSLTNLIINQCSKSDQCANPDFMASSLFCETYRSLPEELQNPKVLSTFAIIFLLSTVLIRDNISSLHAKEMKYNAISGGYRKQEKISDATTQGLFNTKNKQKNPQHLTRTYSHN